MGATDYLLPEGAPLSWGFFGNGFYCNMALSLGWFWCMPGVEIGLVYQDDGAGTFIYSMPCGRYDESDTTATISHIDLGSGNTYGFTHRHISPAGSIGAVSSEVAIETNPASDVLGIGNYPLNVLATPIGRGTGTAGHGQARVTWNYSPFAEPAEPDGFKIYNRSGFRHTITGVDLADDEFNHTGNVTSDFYVGQHIRVSDSIAGNDGEYTVDSVGWNGVITQVGVTSDLVGGGGGGWMLDLWRTSAAGSEAYVAGRRHYDHLSSELTTGTWTFDVRTYESGSELEGRSDSCVINDTADATTGLDNLVATPIFDGYARLTWTYDPTNPTDTPTRFISYHRSDTADAWVADLDSDSYVAARRAYSHTSSELTDRLWYFKVSANAGAEIESDLDSCTIDSTGPALARTITATLPEWT